MRGRWSAFAGEDSPLGATLDLRVEFGDPLVEAGMRCRWRYRRLTDGSGANVSDAPHTDAYARLGIRSTASDLRR